MATIDLRSLISASKKDDMLQTLVSDQGRKVPFFELSQRLEILKEQAPDHFKAMKTISLNDILEYAEKEKLITIHKNDKL